MPQRTGRWLRLAAGALATAAALAAVNANSPATAQLTSAEVRLETTGSAVATLTVGGATTPALPTNTEHPYGWDGAGRFTIASSGSCRIVVNGQVAAEDAGPGAVCRWP